MARLGRAQHFKPLIIRVRGTMAFTSALTETVTLTDTLVHGPGKVLTETTTFTIGANDGVAPTLSNAVTGEIAEVAGVRLAFLVLAAAGLLATILVWLLMPETVVHERSAAAAAP